MDSLEDLRRTSYGRAEITSEEPLASRSFDVYPHQRLIAAMESLPRQLQAVLWHVEVLGHTPDETASVLGMTDSEVTAALVQAREGLLRAHGR